MSDAIENKVAKSGLITLDLEEMRPAWSVVGFDMAEVLWEGLVLKEKDFRAFVSEHDWKAYAGKHVYIHCSSDAIIPTWAYMLIASHLSPVAASAMVGSRASLEQRLWSDFVRHLDLSDLQDKRVILKGCSDEAIPETVYLELTGRLTPVVKSLMFGEPCSTVPVFKRK